MKRTGMILIALAATLAGCGGAGSRQIVGSRDIDGAGDAPSVSKVTDLGTLALIPQVGGALAAPDSDGVYTIGELVLIEGDDFGKLPAVNIGGRPAEPLARTGSGGIIARIPADIPTGEVDVEVSHRRGRGARAIEVARYGLVVEPGAGVVHAISFAGDGAATVKTALDVPGARGVAISHDGAAAYVSADAGGERRSAGLVVIALTASGGPKVLRTVPLTGREAPRVVTAAKAPIAAVIGDGRLTVFDTGNALSPGAYTPVPIRGIEATVAAALHPEGTLLALLSPEGNELLPIDLGTPGSPKAGQAVSLLPDARLPMAVDLGFSPRGDELWVVAGDTREALVGGQHPAKLVQLRVGAGGVTLHRTVELPDVESPLAVAVARRESIGSATAIRSTARKAAIVCASLDRDLMAALGEGTPAAEALAQPRPIGQLVRTDLEGRTEPFWQEEAAVTALELSHDVRWIAAAARKVTRTGGEVGHELGLVVAPLGGGEATYLTLSESPAGDLLDPAAVALTP